MKLLLKILLCLVCALALAALLHLIGMWYLPQFLQKKSFVEPIADGAY